MAKKFRFKFDFGLRSGANGRDGVDGISGRDGLDGVSPRFRYTKTANKDVIPVFVPNNINPGSAWGAIIPSYSAPEAVWCIQADVNPDNTLKSNWTGPVRLSGADGKDGSSAAAPNYNLQFFKAGDTRPDVPTFTDPNGADTQGWQNYPTDSTSRWWVCVATIEGLTNKIMSWSAVSPLNGVDGEDGQPGAPGAPGTPGLDGEDGTPANQREARRAYHTSNTSAPALVRTSRFPPGWVLDKDLPAPTGNQFVWETVATIDPDDNLIGEWGAAVCLSGAPGPAGENGKDAPVTEYRYAKNTSWITPPTINVNARNPGAAWSLTSPEIVEGEALWYTWAQINPDNTLYTIWRTPTPANGERGPQGGTGPIGPPGPTGANGTSGIPGVSYENRFSLGTADTFTATWNSTVATTRNPSSSGWSLNIPDPTATHPYIWMILARILRSANDDNVGALEGSWEIPFRLSGVNGLDGKLGNSQIAYPAGVYSVDVTYVTTDRIAPYVFDPSDNNFYIMNYIGSWLGSALGGKTPYNAGVNEQGEYWWVKIDSHEAIYAKLGIIANGLIGMSVFNREFMFSQQGYRATGGANMVCRWEMNRIPHILQTYVTGNFTIIVENIPYTILYTKDESPETLGNRIADISYQGWDAVFDYDSLDVLFTRLEKGPASAIIHQPGTSGVQAFTYTDTEGSFVNLISPSSQYELFNPDSPSSGDFVPNMLINFLDGSAHFGTGRIRFNSDGSAHFGGGTLTIANDGSVNINSGEHVFNSDGSGLLAGGNISWNADGGLYISAGIASPFISSMELSGLWDTNWGSQFTGPVSTNFIRNDSTGSAIIHSLPTSNVANGWSIRVMSTGGRGYILQTSPVTNKIFHNGAWTNALTVGGDPKMGYELTCVCSTNGTFLAWVVTSEFLLPLIT